jgi:hypothetical protein
MPIVWKTWPSESSTVVWSAWSLSRALKGLFSQHAMGSRGKSPFGAYLPEIA